MSSTRPHALVLGGAGMLGHKIWQRLAADGDATATLRSDTVPPSIAVVLDPERTITGVRAEATDTVAAALERSGAGVVINCVGIVKQHELARDPVASIRVNSLFPHELAVVCKARGARLIHISTDCVFSGRRGGYAESDEPDPIDLYGRTKLLGEVSDPGCLTLRTSLVGRELSRDTGLLEWFLGQRGRTVGGFRHVVFSGLTTAAFADVIAEVIEHHRDLSGVRHISAEPIDKLALLELVREATGIDVAIEPRDEPVIDRSLGSAWFRAEAGWSPPSWQAMVAGLVEDSTPYEEVRGITRLARSV